MKLTAIVPALALVLISSTLYAQRAPIPQAAGGARARITVVRSDEGGVTLDISGLRASVERSERADRIVHNAPLFTSYGDSLALPGIMVTLGVPQGATGFTATVTPTSFDTLALPSVRPYTTAIPAGTAAVGAPIVMRGINTVALRYQPIRYEGGRVITERSARIVLTWKPGGSAAKGGGEYKESAAMQGVLREQILALVADGAADLLILETFGYLDELVEAVSVAASVTSVPLIAQATFADDAHTLGGETPRLD